MACELLTLRQDQTLVLTLSGPSSRNALSAEVVDAALEALSVAESDDGVRCIVLTGDGGHFCAGGDLRTLRAATAPGEPLDTRAQAALVDRFHMLVEAVRAVPKPVIAAVEGHAAGGGFSLALACDLLIAASDAKFQMSYTRIGVSPDGGGSWSLMQALPRALALQLLWLAQPVDAATLRDWGLVNEVCPSGQALSTALRWAGLLAERDAQALASVKELTNAWPQGDLSGQLRRERAHFLDNLARPAAQAAMRAFFERR
jgi:enoyl-CoA hydratase/carnithine racemase